MTVAERKTQKKEELRALILEGAKKLFVKKGIEATTIRNIAVAVNYSVGTVYVYFKDKNAILHALHTQGFTQLVADFKVLSNVADPMARLRAMGKVYISFALQNSDMYDLMFNLKAPIEFLNTIREEEWNEGKATFDVLRKTVKQCLEAGHFKGHKLEPLTFMIWSLVHGMCSLKIGNRATAVNLKNADNILEEAYNEFLKFLDTI